MATKMTYDKGMEHIKDGIDCQLEAARSLNKVKRAYPHLTPQLDKAFAGMDSVKTILKEAENMLRSEATQEAKQ